MFTMSRRIAVAIAALALVACESDNSTGPTAVVSPTSDVCASLAAMPALVVTQGAITSSTIYRIESRWCSSNAPLVQILEFNPSTFTGGLMAGFAFAQNFARLSANGERIDIPAGVTLIGGPRNL